MNQGRENLVLFLVVLATTLAALVVVGSAVHHLIAQLGALLR